MNKSGRRYDLDQPTRLQAAHHTANVGIIYLKVESDLANRIDLMPLDIGYDPPLGRAEGKVADPGCRGRGKEKGGIQVRQFIVFRNR